LAAARYPLRLDKIEAGNKTRIAIESILNDIGIDVEVLIIETSERAIIRGGRVCA
jgi:hypothetical protein